MTSPAPVDLFDHNALRAALIGAKASMESAAPLLERDHPAEARRLRQNAELAEAALSGGGDALLRRVAHQERAGETLVDVTEVIA